MEDVTRPCAHCGDEFTPSGRRHGMAATYCPPCGRGYRQAYKAGEVDSWHAKRITKCPCGTQLPAGCQKYCSPRCRAERGGLRRQSTARRLERRTYTCAMPACHNLCVSSHAAALFCSNACKLIAKNIRRRGLHSVSIHPHWVMLQPVQGPSMDWMTSLPAYGPKLTDWPLYGPPAPPPSREGRCVSCGVTFFGSARQVNCSERCFRNPIDDNNPASCDLESGHCRRCDKPYVSRAYRASSGCCSEACSKRLRKSIEKRRHRARKRGQIHEPYTLREIAERDGWRCHLCGGKVPDRPYTAHDKDPTIDHLIPQSHGGDDIRSNVALAHNRCNWERGNKGLAQLRLTG